VTAVLQLFLFQVQGFTVGEVAPVAEVLSAVAADLFVLLLTGFLATQAGCSVALETVEGTSGTGSYRADLTFLSTRRTKFFLPTFLAHSYTLIFLSFLAQIAFLNTFLTKSIS